MSGTSVADAWRGIAAEGSDEITSGLAGFLRRRSRKLLGSLLRPQSRSLLLGAALVITNSLAILAGPLLIKFAIDSGLTPVLPGGEREGGSLRTLYIVVAVYAVVQVIEALTLRAYLSVTGRAGERILYDLRTRVFDHIQRLSLSFHARYTSGRIISRLTSDVDALAELLNAGLHTLPTALLSLVGISIVLFVLDVPLALAALAVFPVVLLLTRWFRNTSERIYRKVREAVALVIIHFAESLGGIRAVHAYGREPRNQQIFDELNGRYRDANMRSFVASSIYGPGVAALGDIAVAACLVYGGWRVLDGDIRLGVLVAFLLYMRQFFMPVQELSQIYNTFQAAAAALEKLSGVLEEETSVPEPEHPVPARAWAGEVRFDDVTFGYRDAVVLDRLDLRVPAGQTVAIVGPTGAGKSTIARLVARFWDPDEGTVSLDGVDLRQLSNTDLRRAIVLVTQESFLFSGTVASNIAFGRPDATRAEIEDAARTVGAHAFITRMPDGYDTDVRKQGGRLSAGQRQLIALARAFIADPRVIIFDEATSSIDVPSERLIQRALEVVLADRTAFIIAHRLTTVEIADRVLVIDRGRIVEDGPPAQLLDRGGRWSDLQQAWVESLA